MYHLVYIILFNCILPFTTFQLWLETYVNTLAHDFYDVLLCIFQVVQISQKILKANAVSLSMQLKCIVVKQPFHDSS